MRTLTYSAAISESLVQNMSDDPSVLIMGLGVTDYKGIFNTTKAACIQHPTRVIETPACESAMTGVAIGAALSGMKPIVVHARHDFMFLALDQMINGASKWRYATAGQSQVPIVVRAIVGKGWGQGPTHSQSLQSVVAHFPGIKVLMPSTPKDAKGMITASLRQTAPVLIVEHRSLYDTVGPVPEALFETELQKARIIREGNDLTVVATAYLIGEAICVGDYLRDRGISLEIVDPGTFSPIDIETIVHSVKRTGRLLCLDTSWTHFGISAEICTQVTEQALTFLKCPPKRMGCAPCPAPVSKPLEDRFYPSRAGIARNCCQMMDQKVDLTTLPPATDLFWGPY